MSRAPPAAVRKSHRTYCRNCPASCGLVIETEGDRIVSIHGDREHPLTEGYLCVKGRMSGDWHNGEDRLVTPQKRQADGTYRPIEVEIALDEVHERLEAILAKHGPRSIALYYGTGVKMNTLGAMALRSWLKSIGSPYLYSSSTVDQSAKWVTAGRMGMFATGRHKLLDGAEVVLVVGANPPVSHIGPMPNNNPVRWTREAREQGAKVIVIDPRRTEFAQHADLHLAILPGEDASVLAAMIRTILANGWEDAAFCARFVTSMDRLRAAVEPFTAAVAARRARVPEADIVEAARLFATARRRSATSGTGPDMSLHSNLSEHLVEALNAICGAYRRAGEVVRNMGSFARQSAVMEKVMPPSRSWEREPKLWTQDSGLVGGEMPASRIPDEIAQGGLRALVVVGGNPATALGQPEKTLAALERLELLVSIDPRMNATARRAHYVFPTKLPYERHDATTLVDSFFAKPFAQMATPLIEAPEGVLDDWELFWGLSRRAGRVQTLMEYKWGGGVGREYVMDMQVKPRSEELMRWLCESGSLSFDELRAHPEGVVFDLEPLVIAPAGEDDGARLDVCPPDVAEELASVADASDSRRYRLAVRRMLETMNSAFRDASVTRRRYPINHAFMNPADMAREGLKTGDPIEIVSDAGKIVGHARADDTVREGVISMSHQWGQPDPADDPRGETGAFTGRLVSLERDLETINYMPRQSGVPVDIRILAAAKADA